MEHPNNIAFPAVSRFVSRIDFEEAGGFRQKWVGFRRILFGAESRLLLDEMLSREKPDIAHLHNIYHHISLAILPVLKKRGIPVVMTLHDYKPVCPAYKLFLRNSVCERCRDRRFYWCVLRRCVKESRLKSLVCAAEATWHRKYYRQIDLFICPSRFLQEKVREMGFDGVSVHIPNSHQPTTTNRKEDFPPYVLYAGRLVAEKGLQVLIEAVSSLQVDCLIAGDGPERKALEALAQRLGGKRVRFLGHLPFDRLSLLLEKAAVVVVPSIWYENSPFSILEACAHAVPVVASAIGGIPELVIDEVTGLTFNPGDYQELREKIVRLLDDPEKRRMLGERARAMVAERFHPQQYSDALIKAYGLAMNGKIIED